MNIIIAISLLLALLILTLSGQDSEPKPTIIVLEHYTPQPKGCFIPLLAVIAIGLLVSMLQPLA